VQRGELFLRLLCFNGFNPFNIPPQTADTFPVKIGPDEVHIEAERIFICAARAMDWPLREFCRTPIWFAGRKYFLRAKHTDTANRDVYELWLWPDNLTGGSSQGVIYDETYVAERDRTAVVKRRRNWVYLLLLPIYPLLGLCWSRFKNTVFIPLGFEIGAMTKTSVAFAFFFFFIEAILTAWLQHGILATFISSSLLWLDWLLFLALLVDSGMRFSQSLKFDVNNHWGFCEWLLPGR
jgi:hypothetical protein